MIFDEAHEIEDVTGQYFGISVSSTQIEDLRRDIAAIARMKNCGSAELDRILQVAHDMSIRFFGLFAANEGRTAFRHHDAFLEENEEVYDHFLRSIELVALQLSLIKNAPGGDSPAASPDRGVPLSASILDGEPPEIFRVLDREARSRGVHLQATPIDVSSILDGQACLNVSTRSC